MAFSPSHSSQIDTPVPPTTTVAAAHAEGQQLRHCEANEGRRIFVEEEDEEAEEESKNEEVESVNEGGWMAPVVAAVAVAGLKRGKK